MNPNSLPSALLLAAAKQGSLLVVKALLSHESCDPLVRDEAGNTTLHIAARRGHHNIMQELVGRYSTLSAGKNKAGDTPLHLACSKGWDRCVPALATRFPGDLEEKDEHGNLPIHLAALYGHNEVFDCLCDVFGSDPGSSGCGGCNCLHLACAGGHIPVVRRILMKYNFLKDNLEDVGALPSHYAACFGHIRLLTMLLSEYGFSITAIETKSGMNFLHNACLFGKNETMDILINDYGMDPNKRDSSGNTALHMACAGGVTTLDNIVEFKEINSLHFDNYCGRMACIRELVREYKCSVHHTNNNNDTALHVAALYGYSDVVTLLVDKFGGSLNTKGYNGRIPLHQACGGGHLELVEKMINVYHCDPMARDDDGLTPLHHASLEGKTSVVRQLVIKYKSPVNSTESNGYSPLHLASTNGHTGVVKMLLSELGADIQVRSKDNDTALHVAAVNGQSDVVALLVNTFGCSLSTKGYNGRISLHYACNSGHLEFVKKLIDVYQYDPMARDDKGCTPLHVAALAGKERVIRQLVTKYNCPVNCTDNDGDTSLHVASENGITHVVEVLLSELGADIQVRNKKKDTALHLAAQRGHSDVVTLLVDKFGCSLIKKGYKGRIPLHYACDDGHLELVEKMINVYHCDPMARDDDGLTPLHVASLGGSESVIRQLVTNFKCPVNCKDNNHDTSLHIASEEGYTRIVEVLLSELGADIQVRNKQNNTALHVAAVNGQSDVVTLLVDKFNCSLNTKGNDGMIPLHQACGCGHLELVEKMINVYHCDPMAKNDEGLTSLHIAILTKKYEIIEKLLLKYKCNPNIADKAGNTLVHQAKENCNLKILQLLLDVVGSFPSIKNNDGKTPLDVSPLLRIIMPALQPCLSYISKHAVGEHQQVPRKVLLFDKRVEQVLRKRSIYCPLSPDHVQSCGLCYVNKSMKDVNICLFDSVTSFLFQRILSGPALIVICTINVDTPSNQSMNKACSEISLVEEAVSQIDGLNKTVQLFLLGISSCNREYLFTALCENITKKFEGGSLQFSMHFLNCNSKDFSQKVFPIIKNFLTTAIGNVSNPEVRQITHGSIYLLKCLQREYSQKLYIPYTQLAKHLKDYRIMEEGHPEEIDACLRQLEAQGILLTANSAEKSLIILNPLQVFRELGTLLHTARDSLSVAGIYCEKLLCNHFPENDFSLVHSFIDKLQICLEVPNEVINVLLKADIPLTDCDRYFFIPHFASCLKAVKCWKSNPQNIFACGLEVRAIAKPKFFPTRFKNTLFLRTMKLFLDMYKESKTPHVDCELWKGGIHWMIDGVEVVVEVVNAGKSVVVLARSDMCYQLMCIDTVVKMVDTVLEVKNMCCSNTVHKVSVLDPNAFKCSMIPWATDIPSCDATRVARSLKTEARDVGIPFPMTNLKWLQRFSLEGIMFSMSYKIIFSFLESVSEKWPEISIALGMSEEARHRISEASSTSSILCCSRMVEEWLMGSGRRPSWYDLTEALKTLNMDQLADEMLLHWGHHAKVQQMLHNDDLLTQEIEEPFLQQLAVVAEHNWSLLSPYICPLESQFEDSGENTVLSHLQTWKRRMRPTYGDMVEIFRQLYIQPPIPAKFEEKPPKAPSPCNHSCPESLSGLCSTSVHSEWVGLNGGTIECKELGFSITVPPGAVNLPVSISVCCSFKENLHPPEGYELVSPVYVLHATGKITFFEEVQVSLCHWAKLTDSSSLIFALSPVPALDTSPCTLELQNGGEFFPHRGTIQTEHFSLGAILRAIPQAIAAPFKYLLGIQTNKNNSDAKEVLEQNDQVHPKQHHESSSQSQDYQSQISTIYNSYQVFLVHPTQEIGVHEKWHYFLSVSLNHPLFIKNLMVWIPERYHGFCWDYRSKKDMEPKEENLITMLDPKDSFSYIPSQQEIPKHMLDLPHEAFAYANDGNMYPPREIIELERTSENREYTISMKGFNTECQFTLKCPKLGCNTVNGKSAGQLEKSEKELSIKLLHKELQDVQHRWYGIGLQLGLQPAALHTIRHDNGMDCEMCIVAACEKWLEIDKDACWKNVVNALEVIGHKRMAHALKYNMQL